MLHLTSFPSIISIEACDRAHPRSHPHREKTTQESSETLEAELKQPQPDKNLVEQIIGLLKQGLAGVKVLADPVKTIADLIAKAWIPG